MTARITTIYLEQHSDYGKIFMKTPKALMEEEVFAILDNHDKMAYTVMLDRAALSAKNGWVDSRGHVYIYFTVEEACRILKLGRTKVAKIFRVLTEVGLIERVRQGLGRPVIIYVKDIIVEKIAEEIPDTGKCRCKADARDASACSQVVDAADNRVLTVNQETDRRPLSECLDDRETVANKTDKNKTEYNNISYINHIRSAQSETEKRDDDPIDIDIDDKEHLRGFIRHLIHNHIDYGSFEDFRPDDLPLVDDMVDIMTDVIMTDDREITISRIPRPGDFVRKRFLLLKADEIEYVIDSVKRVTTRIRNMRQYLLTSLYNAPDTIGNYYNSIFMSSMTDRAGYRRASYA